MGRHFNYLKYVMRHKWFVFWAAVELRVPLWIALAHDWDKFLPDEWFPYARCFYAPDGSKQYQESVAFARAWMLHQHRNKHHWQWWLEVNIPSHNCSMPLHKTNYLVWDRGEAQRIVLRNSGPTEWHELIEPYPSDDFVPTPMSDLARREMLADWIGAGKASGKPFIWEWYRKNGEKMLLHADTRRWVEAEMAGMEKSENQRRMLGI